MGLPDSTVASSGQSAPPPPPPSYNDTQAANPTLFRQLVQQREIQSNVAQDLLRVIPKCKVIMVVDDSSSMSLPIQEEGKSPFAPKTSTRWLELQKIASILIEYVVALCPNGLDCHFLNRNGLANVTSMAQMSPLFQAPPLGGTPMTQTLHNLFHDMPPLSPGQEFYLVLVLCDGEPDGVHQDLFNVLMHKSHNTHVSFVEFTDDSSDMDFLDAWNGMLQNFDNTDDYREEVARVQAAQGAQFRFNRNDYVAKILLATFVKYYFNLDQTRVGGQGVGQGMGNMTSGQMTSQMTNQASSSAYYGSQINVVQAWAPTGMASNQPTQSAQFVYQSIPQQQQTYIPSSAQVNNNNGNGSCCRIM